MPSVPPAMPADQGLEEVEIRISGLPEEGPKYPLNDSPKFIEDTNIPGSEVPSVRPYKSAVLLPDLFVSFVAQEPRPNPFYLEKKIESEEWMSRLYHWTERDYTIHERADFAYFAAVLSTEAEQCEFRTIVDWCNWFVQYHRLHPIEADQDFARVFDFDDLFDDGHLKDDPKAAGDEVDSLIAIMREENSCVYKSDEYPLRYIFQSIWGRVRKRSFPGAQERFIRSMEGFFSGLTGQVDLCSTSSKPDKETYISLRRESIGVYPCLALVEYFHALQIPDFVFENPAIQTIREIAADVVLLQNDVLSYHKEQAMGVSHNIVHLYRLEGFSQQAAYDKVNELLVARYHQWYISHSEIPIWGEAVDSQVQRYIKGCQDVIVANLNWSFKSERYFGKENEVVRRTRKVSLLP